MNPAMPGLPKKLAPTMIVEILREYTDESHHMTQQEIREALLTHYEMSMDRKAIKRNLDSLIDMGFPIEFSQTKRMMPDPKTGEVHESVKTSDYWFVHDFTDAELRLLIDSLLFSNHLPHSQRLDLVNKLAEQSSKYFRPHVRHVHAVPSNQPHSPELFLNIEQLDEAIETGHKVAFAYMEYGTDGRLTPKLGDDGTPREYVVSPYQMAAREGKYYLICNYDPYDDVSNYRVDRMSDVRILDERVRPFSTLDGAGQGGFDLAAYMAEHVYMYSSANSWCTFRVTRPMISDVIDMFGHDVTFANETDEHVTVTARVNERAMWQFAKNFAPDVLILSPQHLADQVREEAARTVAAYDDMRG